jgi:cytosine/adenosine deaminase-related metal-dependent hydrolase
MEYLEARGVLDHDLRIAHGVWFEGEAERVLAGRPLKVAHCPSANLKLGSGIADLLHLRSLPNLAVGIGCDGAPCNNDLDVLEEMRLAALLQAYRQGPGKFPSIAALELATIEGARAIGMEDLLGSIEPGKRGDLVVLDLERPASFGGEAVSVYDRVVYGAGRDAVRQVVVDGEILVDRGRLVHFEEDHILRRAREEVDSLAARSELR